MTAIGDVVAARREAFYSALESGDWQQCRMQLERVMDDGTVGHCCLGVATRVAMAEGLALTAHGTGFSISFSRDDSRPGRLRTELPVDAVDGVLHPDVVGWYQFGFSNPWLGGSSAMPWLGNVSATDCNDELREDFTQIAARFRESFPADPASVV